MAKWSDLRDNLLPGIFILHAWKGTNKTPVEGGASCSLQMDLAATLQPTAPFWVRNGGIRILERDTSADGQPTSLPAATKYVGPVSYAPTANLGRPTDITLPVLGLPIA